MKNKIKLDKKDHHRSILTETSPSDVPLIFSNEGFYINIKKFLHYKKNGTEVEFTDLFKDCISKDEELSPKLRFKTPTKPYKYQIKKNELKNRTLSLVHPRSQFNQSKFYESYSNLICKITQKSNFSIRAPDKIASAFYSRKIDERYNYKEVDIETIENEIGRKYASSFFSYKGYDRYYKFFESNRYFKLESKFRYLWMFDVANCFGSIYTHTLPWAINEKKFSQDNTANLNNFGNFFDQLTQKSNGNETNGIPIGSEISRIFSEIIFQRIDINIEHHLEAKLNYKIGRDYELIRYVDDYMLFSNDPLIATKCLSVVTKELQAYNLYLNESKFDKFERPFKTEKSTAIFRTKKIVSELREACTEIKFVDNKKLHFPLKIYRKDRLTIDFIKKIKNIIPDKKNYALVSSYLLTSLNQISTDLCRNYKSKLYEIDTSETRTFEVNTKRVLFILFDIMFFINDTAPTTPTSNKLARTILACDKFFEEFLKTDQPEYQANIIEKIENIDFSAGKLHEQMPIESLNILISTYNFDKNNQLSSRKVEQLISEKFLTYFEVVCLLFYIKQHPEYENIMQIVLVNIERIIISEEEFVNDSEKMHLFLDVLSCPYIKRSFKMNVLKHVYKSLQYNSNKNRTKLVDFMSNTYWFINWKIEDIEQLLQRKELKTAY